MGLLLLEKDNLISFEFAIPGVPVGFFLEFLQLAGKYLAVF